MRGSCDDFPLCLLLTLLFCRHSDGYSVLTRKKIIDSSWHRSIKPLLRKHSLREAHSCPQAQASKTPDTTRLGRSFSRTCFIMFEAAISSFHRSTAGGVAGSE
jgi:hypothetical protein